MDDNAYLAFLLIGVALVLVDGQFIYRSGRRYLEHSYGDPVAGASMVRLITVMFHFAVLGLLALLSTIDLGGSSSMAAVVGRLGVVLLLLAVAHGVTLAILGRIRGDQVMETAATRRRELRATQHGTNGPVIGPVPGQSGGRFPSVSPGLEQQAGYTMPDS
jgi:hypothetical protein